MQDQRGRAGWSGWDEFYNYQSRDEQAWRRQPSPLGHLLQTVKTPPHPRLQKPRCAHLCSCQFARSPLRLQHRRCVGLRFPTSTVLGAPSQRASLVGQGPRTQRPQPSAHHHAASPSPHQHLARSPVARAHSSTPGASSHTHACRPHQPPFGASPIRAASDPRARGNDRRSMSL